MGKRKKRILMSLLILSLVLITAGVSYAFFTYMGMGSTENTIQTGSLTFVYDEQNKQGNGITLSNAFPVSDEIGKTQTGANNVFDFQVLATAKGEAINYEIVGQKQANSKLDETMVKVYLTSIVGENEIEIATTIDNGVVKTYGNLNNTIIQNETGKTLYQETVANGVENYKKQFRLRMWLSEDSTDSTNGEWNYNNQTFSMKINVYGNPALQAPKPVMKEISGNILTEVGVDSEKIKNIRFSNTVSVSKEAEYSWDLSQAGNRTVMGYIVKNTTDNTKYDLIIGGDGGVASAKNLSSLFSSMSTVETIDLTYFDTSQATDMSGMFSYCDSLTTIKLGDSFDTSEVTNMNRMFYWNFELVAIDVSGFDTSKVTDMESMFGYCPKVTTIDVSHFNTSQVTTMSDMFHGSSVTKLDLSNFDTSKVTDMMTMFYGCAYLTSLDLSNFDTSQVTTMHNMFANCSSLVSLDLSNFDTFNVVNMSNMFSYCDSLTNLKIDNFDTSNVTEMDSMFAGTSKLSSITLGKKWSKVLNNAFQSWTSTQTIHVLGKISEVDFIQADEGWSGNAMVIYEG